MQILYRCVQGITLCLIVFNSITVCAGQKYDAPEIIKVRQNVETPTEGWQIDQKKAPHLLQTVEIFDGHPHETAHLVPDKDIVNEEGQEVSVWQLIENKENRYWISCSYAHTDIRYIRPVPADATVCEVTYEPQVSVLGYPAIVSIVFK